MEKSVENSGGGHDPEQSPYLDKLRVIEEMRTALSLDNEQTLADLLPRLSTSFRVYPESDGLYTMMNNQRMRVKDAVALILATFDGEKGISH